MSHSSDVCVRPTGLVDALFSRDAVCLLVSSVVLTIMHRPTATR